MDSATGRKRGSVVTSRTCSPSIQISRSSRNESRYCRPVRIILHSCYKFSCFDQQRFVLLLLWNPKLHQPVTHHPERIVKLALDARTGRQGRTHGHPLDNLDGVFSSEPGKIVHSVRIQLLWRTLNQVHKFAVPLRRHPTAVRACELMREATCPKHHNAQLARKTADGTPNSFSHLPAALGWRQRRQNNIDSQRHHGNFPT